MKKNKIIIFILIAIIIVLGLVILLRDNDVSVKEYSNDDIKITYDSTWKLVDDKEFSLEHKKSKSTFTVVSKEVEDNYIDTELSDVIKDIVFDIESQNDDFVLIDTEDNISEEYEGYSYLYEKDNEQVKVNIYKKDDKLVIAYYSASYEYFDVVLDSVDSMLNSLEIKSGIDS